VSAKNPSAIAILVFINPIRMNSTANATLTDRAAGNARRLQ
jgi:hypothetical protein